MDKPVNMTPLPHAMAQTRSSARRMDCRVESLRLAKPFVTATETTTALEVIVVEVQQAGFTGRGEAAGVYFLGETGPSMLSQVASLRDAVEQGCGRTELLLRLPAGGARNAIDCALWDLEMQQGQSAWLAEQLRARPSLPTVATLSLATAAAMAAQARELVDFACLKLKLDADDPVGKTAAVRAARPDARLVVDVNTGWQPQQVAGFARGLADLGVEMIEQPVPLAQALEIPRGASPVPLCADESCRTREDVARLAGAYQMINIKLDKSGGLTEALAMLAVARELGLKVMVGNMIGSSLAMAPAYALALQADLADLDGALYLAEDRQPAMALRQGFIEAPSHGLWG